MIPLPATSVEVLAVEQDGLEPIPLEAILAKHGFRVHTVRDGDAAWAALAKSRPALIVMDIQLPGMDGYELCRRIKADERVRDIPVILLTTLAAPADVICGLACGADNFAVRPLVEEMVIARIRTVLANRVLPENNSASTVHFAGQQYVITSDRRQILNLLLSAYETAVQTNRELRRTRDALQAVEARLAEAERAAKPKATPSSQARSS